jgi:hypothetical protein
MVRKIENAPPGAKKIVVGSKEAQPWRVTLFVRPTLFETELEPVIYYVRGTVDSAGSVAYLKWKEWEKEQAGLGEYQYPDVEDNGIVEAIDEHDFISTYAEILKYKLPHAACGNPKNPTVFTCFGRTNL